MKNHIPYNGTAIAEFDQKLINKHAQVDCEQNTV